MKTFIYLTTCLLAALVPFIHHSSARPADSSTERMLNSFQGAPLSPMAMTESETEFYADFPGKTGYFAVDGRPGESVFLRYTENPTRKLHPAETCFRANGYKTEFSDNVLARVPELSDQDLEWSQFTVVEKGRPFRVRQCIVSLSSGRVWADIPAWYWQTTFSSDDSGPWVAVTWQLPGDQ